MFVNEEVALSLDSVKFVLFGPDCEKMYARVYEYCKMEVKGYFI